jgi:hypothetical protein
MAKNKTFSKTSPKGGKRGCLCDNGKYDSKCCDGSLQAQGIGSGINEGEQVAVNIDTTRVMVFN